MGNTVTVQPRLTRSTFFPGNIVEGTLSVSVSEGSQEYYGIRVICVGELYQRYTTGSGKNRHTHIQSLDISRTVVTVAGSPENVNDKTRHTLENGNHEFPFKFMLSPGAIPSAVVSAGSTTVSVRYLIRAVVETAGSFFDKSGEFPFNVLFPMPAHQWAQPSAVKAEQSLDITCCCCCEKGNVKLTGTMSKSCVALDRDEIQFTCHVDNSECTNDCEGVTVYLMALATAKIGFCRTPQTSFSKTEVPCMIKAGEQGDISGTLRLAPLSPPTIKSPVLDIDYRLDFEANIACASDSRMSCPVIVAHSVDETNQSAQMQEMILQAQPLNPELLQNQGSGVFEVPNLAAPQLAQQVAPPQFQGWTPQPMLPPPGQEMNQMPPPPPQQQQPNAYGSAANQQQQYFPGFATYPGQQYASLPPPPET